MKPSHRKGLLAALLELAVGAVALVTIGVTGFDGKLLVLGGLGYGEEEAAQLIRRFREDHGATDCAALLKAAHDRGEERKPHCDALVYEMVRALEALPREKA